jgi:hypothetical protein
VAITPKEEKKNSCVDVSIIALLIIEIKVAIDGNP